MNVVGGGLLYLLLTFLTLIVLSCHLLGGTGHMVKNKKKQPGEKNEPEE